MLNITKEQLKPRVVDLSLGSYPQIAATVRSWLSKESEKMMLKQLVQFTFVGACAALIDWGVFNWLTGRRWRRGRIPASVASTSCAMVWSFLANWNLVFHPAERSTGIRL